MKAAPFAYVRARSLDEVFDLLAEHGTEARILAGGQSLMPMLALRVASTSLLIDIGGLKDLCGVEERGGTVMIGALARHAELEASELVAKRLPLIARAMPHIAHVAIRNRGTLGGSLAHADPAAQLPACMLALDATMIAVSRAGERRIAAGDFFQGLYSTALADGELLARIEIAATPALTRVHFAQFSRRHGDFAMVGLAAQARAHLSELRLVYFGCGDRPLRAHRAETAALSASATGRQAALMAALGNDLDPPGDLQANPEMRVYLAALLGGRALAELESAQ